MPPGAAPRDECHCVTVAVPFPAADLRMEESLPSRTVVKSENRSFTRKRFSLRSILTVVAFSALAFLAAKQQQRIGELQRRADELSMQEEHLKASLAEALHKLRLMRSQVSDEPTLHVSEVSAGTSNGAP